MKILILQEQVDYRSIARRAHGEEYLYPRGSDNALGIANLVDLQVSFFLVPCPSVLSLPLDVCLHVLYTFITTLPIYYLYIIYVVCKQSTSEHGFTNSILFE